MTTLPSGLFLCVALLTLGCATPSEKYLDAATQLGLNNELLAGSPYQHRLFVNGQASRSETIQELHVYLDGDGTPWTAGVRIADDPTPRNPLVLRMMAKDTTPAVLLGRPCYYGLNKTSPCNESLWTSHRYAAVVVDSMAAALRRWMATKKIDRLVLIGYSGGGSLATLLAAHLKNTSAIITIAANLDVNAWSHFHKYLPPTGSLNPITDARIPSNVRQFHLAGLQDDNVPANIIESFSQTQKNAEYLTMPDYDHACCWLDMWSEFLRTRLIQ